MHRQVQEHAQNCPVSVGNLNFLFPFLLIKSMFCSIGFWLVDYHLSRLMTGRAASGAAGRGCSGYFSRWWN